MHICADSSESLSPVVIMIAGRKSRERERERERDAHKYLVLAWFLRISKHNVWVDQSILLQLLPMRTHARIQKVLSEGAQLCNSDNAFSLF